MTFAQGVLLGLALGYGARLAHVRLRDWWVTWLLERDFRRAQERFKGCKHERAVPVDVGVPAIKCLACWGLSYPDPSNCPPFGYGEWHPNCAPPPGPVLPTVHAGGKSHEDGP